MTSVRFSLATDEHVALRVYNTRGALINTLENRLLAAGRHHATWNGRAARGGQVAAGVYFYRIEWNGLSGTKGIVLLK